MLFVNQDMTEFVNMLQLGFRREVQADSPGTALIMGGLPTTTDKSSGVERGSFDTTFSVWGLGIVH